MNSLLLEPASKYMTPATLTHTMLDKESAQTVIVIALPRTVHHELFSNAFMLV
jgi:hypothetical protein